MFLHGLDVAGLVGRARADALSLGLDQFVLAAKALLPLPFLRRLAADHHADRRVHLALAEIDALLQAVIQVVEHGFGLRDLLGAAGDRDLVAAGHQGRRNMLLDLGEMLVMPAEQQGTAAIVVEGKGAAVDLEGCRNGFQACLSMAGGTDVAGQPSAGWWSTGRPARLWA